MTALISTRFHYLMAPQKETYPYGTYQVISDPHLPFAFGDEHVGQARIQTNIWHTDRFAALSICDTIRDQVHLDAGDWDGIVIHSAMASGTLVMREQDIDVYHAMFDIIVTYRDA